MVELRHPLGSVFSTLAAARRCRLRLHGHSDSRMYAFRSVQRALQSRLYPFNEIRSGIASQILWRAQSSNQKVSVGVQSGDGCGFQSSGQAASGFRRVGAWTMTLAIIGSNWVLISLPASTPESKRAPPAVEGFQTSIGPGDGKKSFGRIFSVEARFNGMAADGNVFLSER